MKSELMALAGRVRRIVFDVYTFQLHPPRLEQLAQQLGECFDSLKEDIDEFGKFLEALADGSEDGA